MIEDPWQPIETFPRTCVPVLGWDGFRFVVAGWTPAPNEAGGIITTSDGIEELTDLIAWMAIPKPPSLLEQPQAHPFASAP